MAFKVKIETLPPVEVDGRRHWGWQITETGVPEEGVPSWVLSSVPLYFTVSLFEISVDDGATVEPKLALEPTDAPLAHVIELPPSPVHRTTQVGVITAPCRRLYGWSRVSGSASATVHTRITIVEGH